MFYFFGADPRINELWTSGNDACDTELRFDPEHPEVDNQVPTSQQKTKAPHLAIGLNACKDK
jgi:hypothetical protein